MSSIVGQKINLIFFKKCFTFPFRIAPSGGNNVVQPLKICIGSSSTGSSTGSSNNSSRKRHRQHSDSSNSSMDSMGDPARKMSRVMGTSTEQESTFLSGRVNLNSYQKPKKVVT